MGFNSAAGLNPRAPLLDRMQANPCLRSVLGRREGQLRGREQRYPRSANAGLWRTPEAPDVAPELPLSADTGLSAATHGARARWRAAFRSSRSTAAIVSGSSVELRSVPASTIRGWLRSPYRPAGESLDGTGSPERKKVEICFGQLELHPEARSAGRDGYSAEVARGQTDGFASRSSIRARARIRSPLPKPSVNLA